MTMIERGVKGPTQILPFYSKKAENEVGRTLEMVRHGRRLRSVITRESEMNLRCLYTSFPTPIRFFLKRLIGLDQLGMLNKISIPDLLAAPQNRHLLYRLKKMGFLFTLMDDKGNLDLRRAGLKENPLHIDLVPKYKKDTLEDYLAKLERHQEKYERKTKSANILMAKFLILAWIDLFKAGEAQSASQYQRVLECFRNLLEKFPFGKTTERNTLEEGIKNITNNLLPKNNYTAAAAQLVSIIDRLHNVIFSQTIEEARAGKPKLNYDEKTGNWSLRKARYRMTEEELMQKELGEDKTSTGLILSMLQHIVDSATQEIGENYAAMIELAVIKNHYPDYWDKLYDLHGRFTGFRSEIKQKAKMEMDGAKELAIMKGKKGQHIRLAISLLGVAEKDIDCRKIEVEGEKEYYTNLIPVAEKMIGDIMKGFVEPIVKTLASPNLLQNPVLIAGIKSRLENILNTFFKGEIREDWIQQMRTRVEKAKELLREAGEKALEVKRKKSGTTKELVTDKMAEAARELLLTGLEHENRHGEVITEADFILGHEEKLDKIKGIIRKKTEIAPEIRRKIRSEIAQGGEIRIKALLNLMDWLMETITNKRNMNSPNLAGELREFMAEVRGSLSIAGMTEVSINQILGRIEKIVNLFNGIRGLIWRKMGERREAEKMLKAKAIYGTRKKLDSIASINNSIMFRLKEVAIVTLQIKYDLENKPHKADQQKRQEFVQAHKALFDAIEALDSEYQEVFLDGKYIGEATPFDIWRLKL